MTRSIRAVAGAAAIAVVGALAVALPSGAAHAATTYTWTGAVSHDWGTPQNWNPQDVPGADDSVLLTNVNGTTTVTLGGPVTVHDISVDEVGANLYLDGAGDLTVTGDFTWTGGDIFVPVTVAGTGRIGAGELKTLGSDSATNHGSITVTGTLLLDAIGTDGDHGLLLYPDYEGDNDGLRISPSGTLRAQGANLVSGTGCCTDPAAILNRGTIDVSTGHTTFREVEVDQRGTVRVARSARLVQTTGPARLGAGATYRGGGTFELVDTAKIAAYPKTDPVPGGVLMEGMGRLADGTRVHLGVGAKLTGVGGFAGTGTVDVSAAANPAQDGAHIYGDLSIGAGTTLRLGGAVPSRLESWSPGMPGYSGVLRIKAKGNAELARGVEFVTQGGTRTTVAKGARLRLQPRSTWGSGDCCTDPARLANAGTVEVTGGGGAVPKMIRVDFRNTGVLGIATGKRLVTQGYPIKVGGTLKLTGKAKPGASRTVLTADKVKGTFGCVRPGGQVAVTGARAVKVIGIAGKSSACVSGSGKKLAAKKVKAHRTIKVKAVKGLAKSVKKVVVAITVTKVKKATKIKVGGATKFKAAKGKTTTRYLVAKRAKKKFVTVKNLGTKPVKVKVVLLGRA